MERSYEVETSLTNHGLCKMLISVMKQARTLTGLSLNFFFSFLFYMTKLSKIAVYLTVYPLKKCPTMYKIHIVPKVNLNVSIKKI